MHKKIYHNIYRQNKEIQDMDKKTALKLARDYVHFLASRNYYKIKGPFYSGHTRRIILPMTAILILLLYWQGIKDTIQELSNLMRLRRNFDLRIEPHPITLKDFQDDNPFNREIKKGFKIL